MSSYRLARAAAIASSLHAKAADRIIVYVCERAVGVVAHIRVRRGRATMAAVLISVLRSLAVVVCLSLTGAAVLVPEHGWLQIAASVSCGAFAWMFGLPPGVVLAQLLARMRPERFAKLVTEAARSMPPESAAVVLSSLHPPPSAAPAAVVFESEKPTEAPPPPRDAL